MPGSCLSSCSLALLISSRGAAAALGALVAALEPVEPFFCGGAAVATENAVIRIRRYFANFMNQPPGTDSTGDCETSTPQRYGRRDETLRKGGANSATEGVNEAAGWRSGHRRLRAPVSCKRIPGAV